mmetsp:Transcript_14044/g.32667  ORF Transcript_14044/g.32667 Transcript_14044/m.32667 type:complete len:343 (-) Transcript_14044:457-1485(-)
MRVLGYHLSHCTTGNARRLGVLETPVRGLLAGSAKNLLSAAALVRGRFRLAGRLHSEPRADPVPDLQLFQGPGRTRPADTGSDVRSVLSHLLLALRLRRRRPSQFLPERSLESRGAAPGGTQQLLRGDLSEPVRGAELVRGDPGALHVRPHTAALVHPLHLHLVPAARVGGGERVRAVSGRPAGRGRRLVQRGGDHRRNTEQPGNRQDRPIPQRRRQGRIGKRRRAAAAVGGTSQENDGGSGRRSEHRPKVRRERMLHLHVGIRRRDGGRSGGRTRRRRGRERRRGPSSPAIRRQQQQQQKQLRVRRLSRGRSNDRSHEMRAHFLQGVPRGLDRRKVLARRR